MSDHPSHPSPPPTRPGARAVRGGLGHGGPAGAHLSPPAPAHVPSEDGGGVPGSRGQHHADVEAGAAAFEEECFADGMPVVFQVRGREGEGGTHTGGRRPPSPRLANPGTGAGLAHVGGERCRNPGRAC